MLQKIRKGRITKRVISSAMALLMALSLLPVGLLSGAMEVKADDGVYVLEAKALTAKTYAETESEKVGTDNFFTIHAVSGTKIDSSNKSFSDGYESGQRINFGGKAAPGTPKNCIEFTTINSATVKIWWVAAGDNRQMGIYKSDKTTIATQTTGKNVSGDKFVTELKLEEAGTYYLGGIENKNYIFKVEIQVDPIINEYVLESKNLTAKTYAETESEKVGTDNFFTIHAVSGTKIDSSSKTFSDGYESGQRINFGGKAAPGTPKNCIEFTTTGTATVKIWWVAAGDNRQMGIYKSDKTTIATQTTGKNVSGDKFVTELKLEEAGTYYLGGIENKNYIFKVQVTDVIGGKLPEVERKDWSEVEAPSLGTPTSKDGKITIPYTMVIGADGADKVVVTVKDSNGTELKQIKKEINGTEGTVEFAPTASGTYTFTIVASRDGEEDKAGAAGVECEFVLPLKTPTIASATSLGGGKVNVVWGAVPEAESYVIYCDDVQVGTSEETNYTVTGLTVGTTYGFTVKAVRGEDESDVSASVKNKVSATAQRVWGFTRYGDSTNDANNGYELGINTDGKVTVYSEGGKGKIQETVDGLAFYYTAIPTEYNFTLRARLTVDKWKYSNGQEGFGIMVTDRLGPNGDSKSFYNNAYMAVASKVEYRWDSTTQTIWPITSAEGTKYSMKLGIGSLVKTDITKENLEAANGGKPAGMTSEYQPLDLTAAEQGQPGGTYNVIGNAESDVAGTIAEITEFILEIQKNNTGYFVSYYDAEGNLIKQIKYYEPEALNQLDAENVYAGFFASRNARVTFSDVELTTILASEDAPAEERPIVTITPSLVIPSADIANNNNYVLPLLPNVDGNVTVKIGDKVLVDNVKLDGELREDIDITLPNSGKNELIIEFTPDANQEMAPYTKLANTDKITITKVVTVATKFAGRNNIYVSPNGRSDASGTKLNPTDIYTAVQNVRPGQTIIIMEGTYKLDATVRVERGIDGTEAEPIRLVVDPDAKTRPVFDFQGKCAGMVFGGDYWYMNGFDVTNSADGQKGMQISGNYNVVDNVNAYHNGNTGIQISRLYSTDLWEDWPAYNTIKNCTSYGNADSGYEDADGFAAKLTVGEGNVFDGCVAYNNADDGWDLFAKVETGPIGAVTIQNCVAYRNGYLEDGTNAGNGNGFKMGGSSISGKHVLKDSYAFFNKAKGIDSNSCPDIIVYNSISYNNESYNVAFYTNNAINTDFFAEGIISFKDDTIKSGKDIDENLKPKGTQDTTKYEKESNYFWNGSASANIKGATATAEWFKSLEFKGITRNEDGIINMNGFLELTEVVPDGVGAEPKGETSDEIEISTNDSVKEEVIVADKTTDSILAKVEEVLAKVEAAAEELIPVVKVEMTEVATELMIGIKGIEITVRLEQENGIIWDINGGEVEGNTKPVDLSVKVDGNEIPKAALDQFKDMADLKDTDKVSTLSVAHDGDFGFVARMKYPVKDSEGKYASLIWYHDGVYETVGACVVEGGYAEFEMTHASDYIVVISDAAVDVAPEMGDITNNTIYVLVLLGAAFVAAGFFAKKRLFIEE